MENNLLLFDFGGTLADTEGIIFPAFNSSLERCGLGRIGKEEFLSLFSGSFHESLPKRFPQLSDKKLLSDFMVAFSEEKGKAYPKLFPGIKDALFALSESGFSLYIVSAANEGFIDETLSREGVRALFSGVFGIESGKSKIEKIRRILSEGNCPADGCVYVGDTSGDFLDSKSAGLKMIAVLWGYHSRGELSDAGASFFAEKPSDIPALAEKISGRRGGF